jgi:hypothetical protein
LEPYTEQHVAWSEDGTKILAAAPTLAELHEVINRQGITHCIVGFVPGDDVDFFGEVDT